MTVLMLFVFVILFGIVLVAFALGARVLEEQRRKRVSAVLETVSAAAAAPQARVLVEQASQGQPALAALLARLNLARKLQDRIQQAGLEWTASRLVAYMAAAGLVGALAGFKLRVLLFAGLSSAALAAICAVLPLVYVMRKRKKRLAEFEQQFPEALDFLARAMRAGHAFPVSLEMLSVESPEPLQAEFRKVYNEQNLGAPLNDVLAHLAERVPLIDVRFFVSAVLMQRETGGNLGDILTKLAYVIRERFRLKGQVRSASAHGRITAAVLTLLPLGTTCLLMAASPEHMLRMAREPLGKYMIVGAIVAQVTGFFIMRKIVNIKV